MIDLEAEERAAAAIPGPSSPGGGSELSFASDILASSPEAMDVDGDASRALDATAGKEAVLPSTDGGPEASNTTDSGQASARGGRAARSADGAAPPAPVDSALSSKAPVLGRGQESFLAATGPGEANDLLPVAAGGDDIWSRPLARLGAHRGIRKRQGGPTSTSFLNDSSSEDEEFVVAPRPQETLQPNAKKKEVSKPSTAARPVRRLRALRMISVKKEEPDVTVSENTPSTPAAATAVTPAESRADGSPNGLSAPAEASAKHLPPLRPDESNPFPAPSSTASVIMQTSDVLRGADAEVAEVAMDGARSVTPKSAAAASPVDAHAVDTADLESASGVDGLVADRDRSPIGETDLSGVNEGHHEEDDHGEIEVVRDTNILAYRLQGAEAGADEGAATTLKPSSAPAPVEVVDGITSEDVSRNPEARTRAQASLDAQVATLSNEANRAARTTGEISSDMVTDVQRLLYLFGCPYLVAPQEAESQCAVLERMGLTQGTVTDDNDVFLFGGRRVYRHVCSRHKRAALYLSDDVERLMGLSQERLISLAYLLGCDYTDGIPTVGPVTAIEILAEFANAEDPLAGFKRWFESIEDPKKPDASDTPAKARLRKLRQKTSLPGGFPNPLVAKTYHEPVVCVLGEGGIEILLIHQATFSSFPSFFFSSAAPLLLSRWTKMTSPFSGAPLTWMDLKNFSRKRWAGTRSTSAAT